MSWNVRYGAKNDGPKVQQFDGPDEEANEKNAKEYAVQVGGVAKPNPKPAPPAK